MHYQRAGTATAAAIDIEHISGRMGLHRLNPFVGNDEEGFKTGPADPAQQAGWR